MELKAWAFECMKGCWSWILFKGNKLSYTYVYIYTSCICIIYIYYKQIWIQQPFKVSWDDSVKVWTSTRNVAIQTETKTKLVLFLVLLLQNQKKFQNGRTIRCKMKKEWCFEFSEATLNFKPCCRHWVFPKPFTWPLAKFTNVASEQTNAWRIVDITYIDAISILISKDVWKCFVWRVYG